MSEPQAETRKGILQGSIYPRNLRGREIEVRVEDETWGRSTEHSLWVRLTDLHEPRPKPALATGGILDNSAFPIVAWNGTGVNSYSYKIDVKNTDPEVLKILLGK